MKVAFWSTPPSRKEAPDARDVKGVLLTNRATLARLMLGVAMYTSQEMPVQLRTHDTPVEMPVVPESLWIDAVGDNGFAAKIVFDAKSRAPIHTVFWGADRTIMTTAFTDRRSTGGMKAAYRIVTTAGDRVVDELEFDEVIVNPSLTKSDFVR